MAIGRFIIKSGVVVGAVYYTQHLGVWGNSQQTEKIYNSVKSTLRPHIKDLEKRLPFEIPALPPRGEVRFTMKHYYNEGVKNTFDFITMIPCYTGQLLMQAKNKVLELTQQAPNSSKDVPSEPKSK